MNIDVSELVPAAERTALRPPRSFGEANTITVARGRRADVRRGVAARITEAAIANAPAHLRTAIVRADQDALTLTF